MTEHVLQDGGGNVLPGQTVVLARNDPSFEYQGMRFIAAGFAETDLTDVPSELHQHMLYAESLNTPPGTLGDVRISATGTIIAVMSEGNYTRIYRSTDNAVTWTKVYDYDPYVNGGFKDLQESNGVWMFIGLNSVHRSADDGVTWSRRELLFDNSSNAKSHSLAWDGADKAIVFGNTQDRYPSYKYSEDGGVTWQTTRVISSILTSAKGYVLYDPVFGFVFHYTIGNSGTLTYRTTRLKTWPFLWEDVTSISGNYAKSLWFFENKLVHSDGASISVFDISSGAIVQSTSAIANLPAVGIGNPAKVGNELIFGSVKASGPLSYIAGYFPGSNPSTDGVQVIFMNSGRIMRSVLAAGKFSPGAVLGGTEYVRVV